MPKTFECPVPYFAGTVTLPDIVNYDALIAWQRAGLASLKLFDRQPDDENGKPVYVIKPDVLDADFRALRVPAIVTLVESWDLKNCPKNPTYKTFPATPKKAAKALYDWLAKLVSDEIDTEELEIPNA